MQPAEKFKEVADVLPKFTIHHDHTGKASRYGSGGGGRERVLSLKYKAVPFSV